MWPRDIMSNPNANLKKGKRTPLPGVRKRHVPFRNSSSLSITDNVLDDALRSSSQQSVRSDTAVMRVPRPPLPKLDHQRQDATAAPSDFDLMNGMMNKIAKLELQVQFYAKEVLEKDKKISILEEKVKVKERYSRMGNQDSSEKLKELEKQCAELQNQIKEMEDFLADYGMVFVGSSNSEEDSVYEELTEQEDSVWRPGASVAQDASFCVNFDKIVKNVKELNILGGEGEKRVQHTVKGAKLTTKESIPLTIYANGIFMFNGPFRSFENPETQQCVQDLMDGYFPSELQNRYPDGVPIKLNDQRDTLFKDPRSREHFPGVGQLLGGEQVPSKLVPSNLDKTTNTDNPHGSEKCGKVLHQTSRPPGTQMSVDQLLRKLPVSVMKNGKVIDVRSGVANSLTNNEAPTSVTVLETPAATKAESNQEVRSSQSRQLVVGPSRVTTLRVKSENGSQTFIVKMNYEDTIRDLKSQLAKSRSASQPDYDLVTSFPNRSYQNLDETLDECGLTPNATLHMKVK